VRGCNNEGRRIFDGYKYENIANSFTCSQLDAGERSEELDHGARFAQTTINYYYYHNIYFCIFSPFDRRARGSMFEYNYDNNNIAACTLIIRSGSGGHRTVRCRACDYYYQSIVLPKLILFFEKSPKNTL